MAYCEASCLRRMPSAPCAGQQCLVEHAQRGDGEAREQLFSLLAPAVMRQAQRLCGADGIAQDVAQAALVLALEHLSELRCPSRVGAWVRRIVINACRMERRSRAVREQNERQGPNGASSASRGDQVLDARRELWRVLHTAPLLPPLLGETFRLRVVEGLTTKQAAERLGVSPEAVRARLSRTRRWLRAMEDGGR